MASRELIIVFLNYTNEELKLDPESLRLEQGEWGTDTKESQPPSEIRAGESGLWRCKSPHVGAGTVGSVTYQIVGYGEGGGVTVSWDVRYVGPSKFEHSCQAGEFATRVLGGSGRQAVAVFVFGMCCQLCRFIQVLLASTTRNYLTDDTS